MNVSQKLLLKDCLPPILLRTLSRRNRYGFFGNYSSWEEAQKQASSYDANIILEKVKAATLLVKQGKAACERDSVVFDQIQYSFPVIAGLLRIAIANQSKLSVLDFGGSLGSSYYQCKGFLSDLSFLRWSIVEQPNFVRCGKELFEDEVLKFYDSIDDCLIVETPQVILLSSVIQYLENPYDFLKKLMDYEFPHILIDRTAFVISGGDRLTVQRVPPSIYPASYPAWFFDQEKFLNMFSDQYDLVFDFDGSDEVNIPSRFKGFYFTRKIDVLD